MSSFCFIRYRLTKYGRYIFTWKRIRSVRDKETGLYMRTYEHWSHEICSLFKFCYRMCTHNLPCRQHHLQRRPFSRLPCFCVSINAAVFIFVAWPQENYQLLDICNKRRRRRKEDSRNCAGNARQRQGQRKIE